MSEAALSGPSRRWVRFTPVERGARALVYVLTAVAVIWSLRTIEIIPEFLYDAPEQTADLFVRMWPFDWAFYPKAVHAALIETLHTATLGTLLALVLAIPFSFLAARNFTRSGPLNWIAQFVFVSSRSVNSLIWALLFVAIFGPGPLAGTLAIAFRSIGFVGKLFGEALEEAQQGPIEALTAAGAPRSMILVKGYWPQVEPAFWSVALLRWDINIRESAVLGLVGAGGIGVALDAALNNLYWDQVGLILAVIFAVVIATEFVTSFIRSRIL
ncbi:phosphonate ABC transporter, permease protein PhnE [Salinarimonas soli]|uniref:Phosphonate ABC transporter, permease protein PhnE n=1 Tax=Salinarimonas soli TaxID=1638099 RepID=A0A5B2W0G1_9HYPH|nr:phosphonate ABC transporter, permease protein PhnE [Salinarimonas soli]KAA2244082.1 phosphonate ABC transporter, permease protein PhnE [Salinarimonas soli]